MDDLPQWTNHPAFILAFLASLVLLSTCAVATGSRVFGAYDRWECRQACAPAGVKSYTGYGGIAGCECKP